MKFHLSFHGFTVSIGSRMGKRPVMTHSYRMANSPDVLIAQRFTAGCNSEGHSGFHENLDP
jgi:hypothetical protein